MNLLSIMTAYLADTLCDGSTRKLIAGWWYSILVMTFLLTLMSFWTVSTRGWAESFQTGWSTCWMIALAVGGTMVMRKYHSSLHTGFFIGGIVATAQYFFLLSLVYAGYSADRYDSGLPRGQDILQSILTMMQSILLGMFALLLISHRKEMKDRQGGGTEEDIEEEGEKEQEEERYETISSFRRDPLQEEGKYYNL